MDQIEVRILDRGFKLQVPPQERERLMQAVQIVDRKMREVRDSGRAQGPDRIAVNAALQLVYEFLCREAQTTTSTTLVPGDELVASDASATGAANAAPTAASPKGGAGTATGTGPAGSAVAAGVPATPSGKGPIAPARAAEAGRDAGRPTPDRPAPADAEKLARDAQIDKISGELEAEIKRQESLF